MNVDVTYFDEDYNEVGHETRKWWRPAGAPALLQ